MPLLLWPCGSRLKVIYMGAGLRELLGRSRESYGSLAYDSGGISHTEETNEFKLIKPLNVIELFIFSLNST